MVLELLRMSLSRAEASLHLGLGSPRKKGRRGRDGDHGEESDNHMGHRTARAQGKAVVGMGGRLSALCPGYHSTPPTPSRDGAGPSPGEACLLSLVSLPC